jgi:hypothetical protein
LFGQLARHGKVRWSLSDAAYDEIETLTKLYNELAGGKWKYMMDFQPRNLAVFHRLPREQATKPMKTLINPLFHFNGADYKSFQGSKPALTGMGYQRGAISLAKNTSVSYEFKAKDIDSYCLMGALARRFSNIYSDKQQVELLNAIRVGSVDAPKALQTIQDMAQPYTNTADTLHLCCYNADSEKINSHWYSQLTTEEKIYFAAGKENGCGVPEVLKLKVGTKVIISANSLEDGYVNGERGTVVALNSKSVSVQKDNGDIVNVIPFIWEKYSLKKVDGKIKRVLESIYQQIPLKMGWAISIHKSQGMTLEKAAIHIGKGCFSNGQLYVALSRLKDLRNISFVSYVSPDNIKVSEHVKLFHQTID